MPISLRRLSENQREAYDEVAASVAALAEADIAAKDLQARVQADVETLNEVERNAPKFDADAARVRLGERRNRDEAEPNASVCDCAQGVSHDGLSA